MDLLRYAETLRVRQGRIHVRLRRINVTPKIPRDLYRSSRTTPPHVFFDQTAARQRLLRRDDTSVPCADTSRRLQRRVQRRVAGRRLAGARGGEAAQRQQVRASLPLRLSRLRVPRHRLAENESAGVYRLLRLAMDVAALARLAENLSDHRAAAAPLPVTTAAPGQKLCTVEGCTRARRAGGTPCCKLHGGGRGHVCVRRGHP